MMELSTGKARISIIDRSTSGPPLSEPASPIWITAFSPSSAIPIADRGHVVAGGLSARLGHDLFGAYRAG